LQIRLPVTGGVSCPDATGLRKFHPCRHSAVSAETTTVGDERCSPAGILFVAVRAHHPAASPIALAESSGAHRLQACSPCVQVPSRSSTAVPRRRTQPAGQSESPFHHVVIAVRSAYAAVNYRRPGLSSRCSPCLELSAAARHVCTVSFHLPKPSEDSPLQPLLSSCQAREVIPSLRPFLLLLLLLLMYLMLGNTGVNTVLCIEHLVAGTKWHVSCFIVYWRLNGCITLRHLLWLEDRKYLQFCFSGMCCFELFCKCTQKSAKCRVILLYSHIRQTGYVAVLPMAALNYCSITPTYLFWVVKVVNTFSFISLLMTCFINIMPCNLFFTST